MAINSNIVTTRNNVAYGAKGSGVARNRYEDRIPTIGLRKLYAKTNSPINSPALPFGAISAGRATETVVIKIVAAPARLITIRIPKKLQKTSCAIANVANPIINEPIIAERV